MQLRKSLAIVAAVATAGLIGLTSASALATNTINGISSAGSVPINGVFLSGNASHAGSTYGCSGGTVSGTAERGPGADAFSFGVLNLNCSTTLGSANMSLIAPCTVPTTFNLSGVTYPATDVVGGTTTFPLVPSPGCVKVSALGGLCTANVVGTVTVAFAEAVVVRAGVSYQDLYLNGSGSFTNQSACLGLLTGSFTLNNIVFSLQVTGGTTTGINFHP